MLTTIKDAREPAAPLGAFLNAEISWSFVYIRKSVTVYFPKPGGCFFHNHISKPFIRS